MMGKEFVEAGVEESQVGPEKLQILQLTEVGHKFCWQILKPKEMQ
jgi:hypothetical protein